ncbi:hypothetical protein SDC9_30414 [bioreactor metagenome]|uniref:RNA-binding S4 domain-containing protein n=1 Tax=bioreactor metagenome TaxID=1076179 RepID=A0A644UZE3_9ZZZZ
MTDTPETPAAPRGEAERAPSERIAKVIARSGVASRRDAEKMIVAGRVTVNGKPVTSPALDVLPTDKVVIDGKPIDAPQETRLWLYYKPLGLVTTEKDEQGRRTIFDEMPEGMPRVLNVGRLDLNSEGLLLLTNDGGLKRRLELPETAWLRKYRVRVNGRPMNDTFDPLRRGITIEGEEFLPMEVTLDRQQGANAWLTVGIREGRNREIRRAMTEIGLTVNRLIRVSYGPFRLNEMQPGEVIEVKRKILRDQLGDRLFSGIEDGRPPRAELIERAQSRATRRAREEGDGGERRPFAPRREDGAEKKGFGRQKDFAQGGAPRGPRPEGDKPFRPRDGERGEGFRPRRDGDDRGPRPEGGKRPFGPRSGEEGRGFKPRGEGFRSHRDEESKFGRGPRPARDEGEKRPYAARSGEEGRGGKPRFGDKPSYGDKPRFGDKPRSGDRPSYGDKPRSGDRPSYGDKPRSGDRPSYGDKPRSGDRPSYGDKPRSGDRPSYGDKPRSGDRPSYGDKPRSSDRPAYGDKPRSGDRPSYGDKPRSGERPAYGDKPRFGGKPGFGKRPEGGERSEGKPAGFKSHGFKSQGGKGKPRAEGFKSHRDGGAGKPGGKPFGRPGPKRG